MKPKEHQINTVQDMIDSTNSQNIDNFIADLKGVLISAHFIKSIDPNFKTDGFTWIDDGENKITTLISENQIP